MSKILYIDYENVQNLDINRIAELDFKVWVFTGVSQSRIGIETVKFTQPLGNKLEWVPIDGSGPNALDFHIAYYLGMHVAEHPNDEYIILSKDKGFDPLISHVVKKKIQCKRIGSISELESASRTSAGTKKAKDGDAIYAKVLKNLNKIEQQKRPRNRKTLRQYVKTLAGKTQTDQKVDQIIDQLFTEEVIFDAEGKLTYKM